MARAYWPEQRAVGRRVKIGGADSTTEWLTIVGVANDVRSSDPTAPPVRHLYLPFEQHPVRSLTFVAAIRTAWGAARVLVALTGGSRSEISTSCDVAGTSAARHAARGARTP